MNFSLGSCFWVVTKCLKSIRSIETFSPIKNDLTLNFKSTHHQKCSTSRRPMNILWCFMLEEFNQTEFYFQIVDITKHKNWPIRSCFSGPGFSDSGFSSQFPFEIAFNEISCLNVEANKAAIKSQQQWGRDESVSETDSDAAIGKKLNVSQSTWTGPHGRWTR